MLKHKPWTTILALAEQSRDIGKLSMERGSIVKAVGEDKDISDELMEWVDHVLGQDMVTLNSWKHPIEPNDASYLHGFYRLKPEIIAKLDKDNTKSNIKTDPGAGSSSGGGGSSSGCLTS